MKIFKKYWFKILSILAIILIAVYVIFFGFNKAKQNEMYKEQIVETKIYTVWHIETFEGGKKPRIDYLKQIARVMEKENPATLFMIKQINPNDLSIAMEKETPDIVSFGFGVGEILLSKLKNFDSTYNVRDELIASGSFDDKLYAIPYIVSGYALLTHGIDTNKFHCGTTNYTKPEKIYNSLNRNLAEIESQYEAYKDFVYNKDVTLLGTGRDVFRVSNLNNIGRANASITPIDSYTDLIQYVGVTIQDDITKKFVDLILSQNYQNSLVDYALFSSKYNKLYSDGIYNDMEDAIFSCQIPSVFYE